jgi:hypothetical protein
MPECVLLNWSHMATLVVDWSKAKVCPALGHHATCWQVSLYFWQLGDIVCFFHPGAIRISSCLRYCEYALPPRSGITVAGCVMFGGPMASLVSHQIVHGIVSPGSCSTIVQAGGVPKTAAVSQCQKSSFPL